MPGPGDPWQTASRTISEALLKHLPTVLGGAARWPSEPVIEHALPVVRGTIRDPRILAFQGRDSAYPHEIPG